MKGRIKEDDASVPRPHGPFEYYWRYETGAQYRVRSAPPARRRPRDGAAGRRGAGQGQGLLPRAGADHSPDHALFAYADDEQGSEVYRLYVKDLATGAVLPQPAESAAGGFTFSADGAWLFWIWRDDNARPAKVFRRPARGGDDDVLVYEEPDDGFFLSVGRTSSDALRRHRGRITKRPRSD